MRFFHRFAGGKVLSWGRGTSGQLGHGQMESSLVPKPVLGLESHFISHVAAGWSHSGFVSGFLSYQSLCISIAWLILGFGSCDRSGNKSRFSS